MNGIIEDCAGAENKEYLGRWAKGKGGFHLGMETHLPAFASKLHGLLGMFQRSRDSGARHFPTMPGRDGDGCSSLPGPEAQRLCGFRLLIPPLWTLFLPLYNEQSDGRGGGEITQQACFEI